MIIVKHFDVPKVFKSKYLKSRLPSLCKIIEQQDFQEIEIRVNQQDTQTFVMQTSRSEIYSQDYFIEVNLMKVISHELLNSITPIRSFSQNLQELVQQETISSDDLDDMKSSIAKMLRRSDHLQQFVESYRKLALLPSPKKEKIELLQWIEKKPKGIKKLHYF